MRGLLIAIGLLTAPVGALALTWDFDEDTTWGWTAQESTLSTATVSSLTTVYSEVEDGVWRIAPVPDGQRPAIRLNSPPIGEDSALFDRVTLRLRIIHHTPTEGGLFMYWSNTAFKRLIEESRAFSIDLDGRLPFSMGRYQIYPTQWEDITIDIRALEAAAAAGPAAEIVWQDTLFGFEMDLDLNSNPQGPADHPTFVEVDWIQLTGVEELLLGELPPRDIVVETGLPGDLFAEPDFFPLGEGIVMNNSIPSWDRALGDVDGDGDVDLVLGWDRLTDEGVRGGWLVASNDGLGGFVPTQEVLLSKGKGSAYIHPTIKGGDFDGDGLLDLVVTRGGSVDLLHNRGEAGFEPILHLSDVFITALADGDGDGDVDLLGMEYGDTWSNVIMWVNDGAAGFVRRDRFDLDTEDPLFVLALDGQPWDEAVRLLWTRPCYLPQGTWQLTQPWGGRKEPPLFLAAVVNPCQLHLLTDLDGDGAVELIGAPERYLQANFELALLC